MPVVHPERPDSTCAAAGAPRSSICLVGPTHARAAHCCLPATGPRATTCAAADKPGLVSGLLCVNFLIVPTFLLLLSSCRVEVSGCVMPLRRVVPGECVVMSVHEVCVDWELSASRMRHLLYNCFTERSNCSPQTLLDGTVRLVVCVISRAPQHGAGCRGTPGENPILCG